VLAPARSTRGAAERSRPPTLVLGCGAGDATGRARPLALRPAHLARRREQATGRHRLPALETGHARSSSGRRERLRSSCIVTCKIRAKPRCATTIHVQCSVRLGEEEEVVEQLLCPKMTRWRWRSSTRRRSCGSGRGTSGGCAAQNAASLTPVWSRIAMPDGATDSGALVAAPPGAESLGVKRWPSHARCALLLSHDVMMTPYTLLFF
jgi:hypothetical protein